MILSPLNSEAAKAPFIYRQFGAMIANLFLKSGIYYEAGISFTSIPLEKRVFFSALLSNYVAIFLTANVVAVTIDKLIGGKNISYGLLGGLLLFCSFGTLSYSLTGLMEGWAIFLISVAFFALLFKKIFIYLVALLVSVAQKETIALAMIGLSVMLCFFESNDDRWKPKYLIYSLAPIIAFGLYLLPSWR